MNIHPNPNRLRKQDAMINSGSGTFNDMSDASLVVAIGRWSPDALKEAYRRHAGAVWALAKRLLNDEIRAEDVTQEVFLDIWNQPEKYDSERGTLRTYLLTRSHSRSVDLIRSDAARRRREEADTRSIELVINDLERQVVDLAMTEHVKRAFDDLPEGERSVIELTYFKGYTYREAAKVLDEPEGTVKSRIRLALKHLRNLIPMTVEDS